MRPLFLLLLSACLIQAQPSAGDGQLGAPIEWLELPEEAGKSVMVQKSSDGRLFLTPNEAFFPQRGLKAVGTGSVEDQRNLNGGQSFAAIEGWTEDQSAIWPLYLPETGTLTVQLEQDGDASFHIALGDGEPTPLKSGRNVLPIHEPGMHALSLICRRADSGASVKHLEVSGRGDLAVIRKRWRPAAAHTKFSSSDVSGKVRLWILEMDALPGELDFYCPVTTPFGYYGPTWNADGTVNTSFNFSLWSFGRGQAEPPVEQLSHLIAIGNPEATFGGFDHEGTGVKIRDWEPLEGRQGQRQTLALRVEPGEMYDTYYSYFFAADEGRWRLFGAGKKFNKRKPLDSLWVGSFVEVPGPPPVQRTGLWERSMRYRGWVMKENGRWHALDQMQNGNVDRETGLTHTDRGLTEDGWFYLQTGGWTFQEPPNGGEELRLKVNGKPDAAYLDPGDLEFLQSVPSQIEILEVERRRDAIQVTFQIENAGSEAEAFLYHGEEEGLTFVDRWSDAVRVERPRDGEQQMVVTDLPESGELHLRMFLHNEEGQFWSAETTVVK